MKKYNLIELLNKYLEIRDKSINLKLKFFPVLIILVFILAFVGTFFNRVVESFNNASNNVIKYDIGFTHISDANIYNNATEIEQAYISSDAKTIKNININLPSVESYILYDVRIFNISSTDKKINIIPIFDMTYEQKDLIDIRFYYSDGTEVINGDNINAKDYKDIQVKISYKNYVTNKMLENTFNINGSIKIMQE